MLRRQTKWNTTTPALGSSKEVSFLPRFTTHYKVWSKEVPGDLEDKDNLLNNSFGASEAVDIISQLNLPINYWLAKLNIERHEMHLLTNLRFFSFSSCQVSSLCPNLSISQIVLHVKVLINVFAFLPLYSWCVVLQRVRSHFVRQDTPVSCLCLNFKTETVLRQVATTIVQAKQTLRKGYGDLWIYQEEENERDLEMSVEHFEQRTLSKWFPSNTGEQDQRRNKEQCCNLEASRYNLLWQSALTAISWQKQRNEGFFNHRATVLRPPPGTKIQHLPEGSETETKYLSTISRLLRIQNTNIRGKQCELNEESDITGLNWYKMDFYLDLKKLYAPASTSCQQPTAGPAKKSATTNIAILADGGKKTERVSFHGVKLLGQVKVVPQEQNRRLLRSTSAKRFSPLEEGMNRKHSDTGERQPQNHQNAHDEPLKRSDSAARLSKSVVTRGNPSPVLKIWQERESKINTETHRQPEERMRRAESIIENRRTKESYASVVKRSSSFHKSTPLRSSDGMEQVSSIALRASDEIVRQPLRTSQDPIETITHQTQSGNDCIPLDSPHQLNTDTTSHITTEMSDSDDSDEESMSSDLDSMRMDNAPVVELAKQAKPSPSVTPPSPFSSRPIIGLRSTQDLLDRILHEPLEAIRSEKRSSSESMKLRAEIPKRLDRRAITLPSAINEAYFQSHSTELAPQISHQRMSTVALSEDEIEQYVRLSGEIPPINADVSTSHEDTVHDASDSNSSQEKSTLQDKTMTSKEKRMTSQERMRAMTSAQYDKERNRSKTTVTSFLLASRSPPMSRRPTTESFPQEHLFVSAVPSVLKPRSGTISSPPTSTTPSSETTSPQSSFLFSPPPGHASLQILPPVDVENNSSPYKPKKRNERHQTLSSGTPPRGKVHYSGSKRTDESAGIVATLFGGLLSRKTGNKHGELKFLLALPTASTHPTQMVDRCVPPTELIPSLGGSNCDHGSWGSETHSTMETTGFVLTLCGKGLDRMDGAFRKSDPYVIIKDQKSQEIYRSEVVNQTLDPVWKTFELSTADCSGFNAPLILEDEDGQDDFIGGMTTSLKELTDSSTVLRIINSKKVGKAFYKHSGKVVVTACRATSTVTKRQAYDNYLVTFRASGLDKNSLITKLNVSIQIRTVSEDETTENPVIAESEIYFNKNNPIWKPVTLSTEEAGGLKGKLSIDVIDSRHNKPFLLGTVHTSLKEILGNSPQLPILKHSKGGSSKPAGILYVDFVEGQGKTVTVDSARESVSEFTWKRPESDIKDTHSHFPTSEPVDLKSSIPATNITPVGSLDRSKTLDQEAPKNEPQTKISGPRFTPIPQVEPTTANKPLSFFFVLSVLSVAFLLSQFLCARPDKAQDRDRSTHKDDQKYAGEDNASAEVDPLQRTGGTAAFFQNENCYRFSSAGRDSTPSVAELEESSSSYLSPDVVKEALSSIKAKLREEDGGQFESTELEDLETGHDETAYYLLVQLESQQAEFSARGSRTTIEQTKE
ncbi:copine-2 [Planoprotostelium fungivorum]|uniref:Copine-2 n=1 Tax=Planoprotostelium fungivorum TaxID=1890364 RepID=A0A2P6NXT3_9EUKA|nr:copine-2 [Planoprotostelium fungivorum]